MNELKYLPTKATGKIDGGRLFHGTPGTRTRAHREGGAERGVRSALEPAGAGVRRLPAAPRGRAGGVTARGLRFLTAGSDSGSTDLAGWARGRVETCEACG